MSPRIEIISQIQANNTKNQKIDTITSHSNITSSCPGQQPPSELTRGSDPVISLHSHELRRPRSPRVTSERSKRSEIDGAGRADESWCRLFTGEVEAADGLRRDTARAGRRPVAGRAQPHLEHMRRLAMASSTMASLLVPENEVRSVAARRLSGLVGVLVTVTVLAGCQSSGSSSEPTSAAPNTTTASSTSESTES